MLKWGKFGSFYACSAFSKAKPMTVAAGPWKKDPKAVVKKMTTAFHFPMEVKAVTEDVTDFSKQVADAKELTAAVNEAQGKGKKIVVEPVSCDFTKENFAAKPDLSAPGRRRRSRRGVLRQLRPRDGVAQWPVGAVHGLPGV